MYIFSPIIQHFSPQFAALIFNCIHEAVITS